jgi:hypothetical protein
MGELMELTIIVTDKPIIPQPYIATEISQEKKESALIIFIARRFICKPARFQLRTFHQQLKNPLCVVSPLVCVFQKLVVSNHQSRPIHPLHIC